MPNTCKLNEDLNDIKVLISFKKLVADGWVTRKNLPLGKVKHLETVANTLYAEKLKINYKLKLIPPKDELASD